MQGFLKGWSQKAHVQKGLAYYYWPRVIGDSLKDKIEVSHVRNGILWVKTPDPALAHNLTFFKNEIIAKYRRFLGGNYIRGVRITVGALTPDYNQRKTEKTRKEPVRDPDLPLPAAIEGIKDADLKQAFCRFYYAHQARK
ncbi:MAG: DUF721 domain-containing protein [Firmicutes bacterium]|nr:DUF721 domain-containing protein [Bacillota bacterium]